MRRLVLISVFFFFLSCSDSISKEDLQKLDGYWEIKKVVFPDGTEKEYNVNTAVDYIQLKGLEGFRKKVHPQLDGTYKTTDDAEAFKIIETEGVYKIQYKTDLSEWTERLTELTENYFSVVNEENISYEYKRFEPINVNN